MFLKLFFGFCNRRDVFEFDKRVGFVVGCDFINFLIVIFVCGVVYVVDELEYEIEYFNSNEGL